MGEDNPAGSLTFLFPTDFTDTHRLLTYGVQADLQSAASKNAVAGLGITTPRLSLEKTESLHFRLFRLSEAFLIWFF